MPQLPKIEHEVFARAIVEGLTGLDAYLKAQGELETADARRRKAAKVSANRWLTRGDIDARIREIRLTRETSSHKAEAKALNTLEITKERVLAELAKIAYADLTQALAWGAKVVVTSEGGEEVEVQNTVALVDSIKLHPHISAAIKSISQTAQGIRIEFHDKKGALLALLEYCEKVEGAGAAADGAAPGGAVPKAPDADRMAGLADRYKLKVVQGGKA